MVEHAMILSKSENLVIHVPKFRSSEASAPRNLEEMERRHIVAFWRGPGGAWPEKAVRPKCLA